jgi:hypothetical protein
MPIKVTVTPSKSESRSTVESVKHAPQPRGVRVFRGQEVDWSIFERPKSSRHLRGRSTIERTIVWIGRYRHMSKDYEYLQTAARPRSTLSWFG